MSRKKNKSKKLIMLSTLMFAFLAVGYAAFETNINLKVKGNVKETATSESLKKTVVTSGEGLYKDTIEEERYIYKGESPNNYIKINNDLYRIISIENDNTLKVMKNDKLVIGAFDTADNRYDEGNYCSGIHNDKYAGCNVWGSINTVLDKNLNNVSTWPEHYGSSTYYKLPNKEASINTYLNETFYNSFSQTVQKNIVKHAFNIGAVNQNAQDTSIKAIYNQITKYKWIGKIGLIDITDYMNASLNEECQTSLQNNTENKCNSVETCSCAKSNFIGISQKAITPIRADGTSRTTVITIGYNGQIVTNTAASSSNSIYKTYKPVFFLSKDTILIGKGEESNPFEILTKKK